jgi:hypothetical protein
MPQLLTDSPEMNRESENKPDDRRIHSGSRSVSEETLRHSNNIHGEITEEMHFLCPLRIEKLSGQ